MPPNPLKFLEGPLMAVKRRRNLIVFFAATHVVFLVFGQWMVARQIPGVLLLRAEQLKMIQDLPFLKPLTGLLAESLALKILYTFIFNLIFGAFLSTTLTGVIFFFPYMIAVWRSFIIGVLIYGLDISPLKLAVFYGTFILEFGGYTLSSAAGMDIGLSLIWPLRKGTRSRKEALLASIRDARLLYALVIVILIISAIWEIGWLQLLGPFIPPGELLK